MLGRVVISHDELLDGTGDRMEYEISVENEFTTSRRMNISQRFGKKKPKLYLRFKEADDDEIEVS